MDDALDFAIDALAVARITRLLVLDEIFADQRTKAWTWLNDHYGPKAAYLTGCPFCTSVYVAAGVLTARRLGAWRTVARVLAMSQVAGMVTR